MSNMTLYLALQDAKKKANQHRESMELTGVDTDGEGKPYDPYKELEDLLVKNLEEVRELRTHAHKWDENDLCSVCNADGRA
jgi:hypothetical protein